MKSLKQIVSQIIIFFLLNLPSFASSNFQIITKVGNEIITSFELKNKIKTTLFLAGEELSQNNVNDIKNLSLEYLINTKLKKEELKKYNFERNNELRVKSYLENLSQKLNIKTADLEKVFLANDLEFNLFLEEIKTEFLWQSLIYEIYSKKINLDENEITRELNKIISNQQAILEYNLSKIETKILKEDELIDIMNYIKNFSFQKAAQKYSIAYTSVNGGNIGWVNSESLSNNILELVKNLKIGEYSKPMKRDTSILIFYLNDKRQISNLNKNNLEKLKTSIINKKTNSLLNIYSNNHLSIKKNKTLIEYQ